MVFAKLKKLGKKKIALHYKTYFTFCIFMFGFLGIFKPMFIDKNYLVDIGSTFSIAMMCIFIVMFYFYDEKEKKNV